MLDNHFGWRAFCFRRTPPSWLPQIGDEGIPSQVMPDILRVEIPWVALEDDRDPEWSANFCLYAYLHPDRDWLLYVGKADHQTVRQRLHGDHKADVFDFFDREYGVEQVRVLQGDL